MLIGVAAGGASVLRRGPANYLKNVVGRSSQEQVRSQDADVSGFNIGVNSGVDAGQTVDHVHIHLIPRRFGDVENPRGGIRNVVPQRAD